MERGALEKSRSKEWREEGWRQKAKTGVERRRREEYYKKRHSISHW